MTAPDQWFQGFEFAHSKRGIHTFIMVSGLRGREIDFIRLCGSNIVPDDERDQEKSDGIALPSHIAGSGTLDRLVDTARDYAQASTAENTDKAYVADWRHFGRWCRIKGKDLLPLPPKMVGLSLYLADFIRMGGLQQSRLRPSNGASPALPIIRK